MKWIVISLVFQFILRLRFPAHKSIAQVITTRYGKPTLNLIRKFENIDFKRRKALRDIEFLNNCIKHELVPKFVQFKVANRGLRGSRVYKQCQMKLLNQELKEKQSHLKSLNRSFSQLKVEIQNKISIIDFAHVSTKFLVKNDRVLNKIRLNQEKKLFNLGLRTANETNNPEKVIFNFSSRVLISSEKTLLTKGLNLSIPPKKLNYGDFLMPFELLYKQMIGKLKSDYSNIELDPVGAAIKEAAYDCYHSYDPKIEQNLSPDEYNALKTLLKDDSIVIQKSDKGNSVVILNKIDYTQMSRNFVN